MRSSGSQTKKVEAEKEIERVTRINESPSVTEGVPVFRVYFLAIQSAFLATMELL